VLAHYLVGSDRLKDLMLLSFAEFRYKNWAALFGHVDSARLSGALGQST
jgi:hypothetical protein